MWGGKGEKKEEFIKFGSFMSITFLAFVLERVKDGSWKDPSLKNKTKQTETSLGIQVLCLQN